MKGQTVSHILFLLHIKIRRDSAIASQLGYLNYICFKTFQQLLFFLIIIGEIQHFYYKQLGESVVFLRECYDLNIYFKSNQPIQCKKNHSFSINYIIFRLKSKSSSFTSKFPLDATKFVVNASGKGTFGTTLITQQTTCYKRVQFQLLLRVRRSTHWSNNEVGAAAVITLWFLFKQFRYVVFVQ